MPDRAATVDKLTIALENVPSRDYPFERLTLLGPAFERFDRASRRRSRDQLVPLRLHDYEFLLREFREDVDLQDFRERGVERGGALE